VAVPANVLPPRYEAPQLVARGGMGEIYRATDASLGRTVAVKVLAERYAADDNVRKRFTREALAAARLSGEPNTITIYDVGEWEGRPFIVMEYLPGGSLDDVLRDEGRQEPGRALAWLEQTSLALDRAHARGVVHRDVKPANLLLDGDRNVHVADFGIATAAGLDSLTQTGTVLGTAGYLAPEQAEGRPATAATDRYALGVVGFELLTGSRPFEHESLTAEAAAHVHAPVPDASARAPGLPSDLDVVFRRALAKEPERRFASAREFVSAARAAFDDAEGGTTRILAAPAARRRARWPALLVLGALLALGGGVAAAVLATRGSNRVTVHTVTRPGTTIRQTITTMPTTSPAQPPTDPHAFNNAGYEKMLAGDYQGALPLLQQAVAGLHDPSDPVTAYANYNLGQTLVRLGRCPDALPYLETAHHLEPTRHEAQDALKFARECAKGKG
jgi:tRNA A-37 threonylcarbamoyl transferase component Bud32/TolA-binding protein